MSPSKLLQVEGENAYQFLLQPPNAPAFIGNTVSVHCDGFIYILTNISLHFMSLFCATHSLIRPQNEFHLKIQVTLYLVSTFRKYSLTP